MSLKEEIYKLVQLQKLDSKVYRLNQEKNIQIPAQLEKLTADFEVKKKYLEAADKSFKELQLKKKSKELDLASKEDAVRKAQAQLYQLKTNKEYQVKLAEIASLKADVSLLEEDVLTIMDSFDAQEIMVKEEKEKLAQEEKKFKETCQIAQSRAREMEAEIKGLIDQRDVHARGVDVAIYPKYERLLTTRSGLAIVPADVEQETCGACHMRVTAQTINEIKMYKEPVFCESCTRMLYVAEDIPV
ncbi:MAG: C4-type zinc ribbon domain-containing protein [Candidatus Omnitrophota bacterium]